MAFPTHDHFKIKVLPADFQALNLYEFPFQNCGSMGLRSERFRRDLFPFQLHPESVLKESPCVKITLSKISKRAVISFLC